MWLKPLFLALFAVVTALFVHNGGLSGLSAPGELVTAAGRITGLWATYLILVQLVLIGRNSLIERFAGMDRLVAWHRFLGKASFYFLCAHIVLVTWGYGVMDHVSFFRQLFDSLEKGRDIAMAGLAFVFMVMVVVTSIRMARRRLKYETWHFVHLYVYLSIALAFPHQLYDGTDFVDHPLSQAVWGVLYFVSVGSIVWFRLGVPLVMMLRFGMHVTNVVAEADHTQSVYISGRYLGSSRPKQVSFSSGVS